MFDMRMAVKSALAKKKRTMTNVCDAIGKSRPTFTTALYNGNPQLDTIKLFVYELDLSLSDFFEMGEK